MSRVASLLASPPHTDGSTFRRRFDASVTSSDVGVDIKQWADTGGIYTGVNP